MIKKNNQKINDIKLLIIGSGRWSIEILKELLNKVLNKRNIYIFGKTRKIKQIQKKFKINSIDSLTQIKDRKITHTIICNKTNNHYQTFKKLYKFNTNILIEKPLTDSDKNNFYIFKKSNKINNKIYISSQFYFSDFFLSLKKYIFNNRLKIKKLIFYWHDKKNENRNGAIKSQNYSVKFIIDVFYHFFSIFNSINIKKNRDKFIIKKSFFKKNFFSFQLNNVFIEMHINRKSQFRKRIIKIYDENRNLLKVNFNKIPEFSFKNYDFNYKKKDKCLSKQLKAFIFNDINKISNILLQNNKSLFINLKKINKTK